MVELARVRTARPRLQLLVVEGIAVEVAVDDDVGVSAKRDGGGRRLMGGMGWRTEDVGVSQLVER